MFLCFVRSHVWNGKERIASNRSATSYTYHLPGCPAAAALNVYFCRFLPLTGRVPAGKMAKRQLRRGENTEGEALILTTGPLMSVIVPKNASDDVSAVAASAAYRPVPIHDLIYQRAYCSMIGSFTACLSIEESYLRRARTSLLHMYSRASRSGPLMRRCTDDALDLVTLRVALVAIEASSVSPPDFLSQARHI